MQERTLVQKWKDFLSILLSPGSIIPFFLASISLALSIFIFTGALSNLLSIFASILTAIAGFFVKDDWDKLQGNSMLEKKGKSAIRNLESIGQQITQIRGWIKSFINSKNASEKELREIDRHLTTTEMNIKSGLEDWIDIVPELKKKEEVAKKYQDVMEAHLEELFKNKTELLKVGENKELREQLEKRIKELEKNVKELKNQRQLAVFSGGLATSSTPLSYASISPSSFTSPSTKTCSNCGRKYNNDDLTIQHLMSFDDLCPNCRGKMSS